MWILGKLNCEDPPAGSVDDALSMDLWLENRDTVVASWDDEANKNAEAKIPRLRVGLASSDRRLEASSTSTGSVVDRLARRIRLLHYSHRTEEAYAGWWQRFVDYIRPADELTLGNDDARRFLEYLAVERHVSASTQNQALNALVFIFKEILRRPLGEPEMHLAQRPLWQWSSGLCISKNNHLVSCSDQHNHRGGIALVIPS
jgi:hypothetical protein